MKRLFCGSVILLIVLFIGGLSGIYLDRKVLRPFSGNTEIKTIHKPTVKYEKAVTPTDTEQLNGCYKSVIQMQFSVGQVNTYTLPVRVRAFDECKSTEQEFTVEVGQGDGWKWKVGIVGTVTVAALAGGVWLGHRLK